MKKQFFLSLIAVIAATGSIMAQGYPQQKAPAERAKETAAKLKTDLTLTADQDAKVYKLFESMFTAKQTAMEEMRNSGSMDREKMKETRDKLNAERDAKLKGILTEDQMKKWITDVEPGMRPQRRAPGSN